jgi:hypothetical protein
MKAFKLYAIALALILHTSVAMAADWYVSPSGRASGVGNISDPLDIVTALSGVRAKPGDTVWLRGGVYKGHYSSYLKGNSTAPIKLRQYPNERAVIDGSLTINGAYAWYMGFEVTNTHKADLPMPDSGVVVLGPNVKCINLVIHHCVKNGIGFWKTATDSEVYGCLIFDNGYQGTDRWHGHGIYMQNEVGWKKVRETIILRQGEKGIAAFGKSPTMRNMLFEGNVLFENLVNIIVGGTDNPMTDVIFRSNFLYGSCAAFGYTATGNQRLTVENNKFVTPEKVRVFFIRDWNNYTVRNNLFYGPDVLVYWVKPTNLTSYTHTWSKNTYITNSLCTKPFNRDPYGWYTFTNWKSSMNSDLDSTWKQGTSAGLIYLRRNYYDSSRANLIVYNLAKQNFAYVNLSSTFALGKQFEIRDVRNFFGPPVATGTVTSSSIALPMRDPSGTANREFNCYIVTVK